MHFTRYACFGAIAVVILLMPSSTSIAEGSVLERIHHIHILHKMAETACTLVYNENYPQPPMPGIDTSSNTASYERLV